MGEENLGLLEEIDSKKAEIVERTPFDTLEDNIVRQVLEERLEGLYDLIERNPELTKEYVKEALKKGLESVEDRLDEINSKVNTLLPKSKKKREVQPLRDPMDRKLFPLFLQNAGNNFIYRKDLKEAQIRVAYTILYHTGLRINEIRMLTRKDINEAIKGGQFNVIHFKTNQAHIHVISSTAVQDLEKRYLDYQIIFDKYKYEYLFGENKPMHSKALIKTINDDLRNTCETLKLPYNIKSHSFRINHISSLLKVTTVQNTADIIGHKDIRSTIYYKRYALSKKEIEELLEKIVDTK